MVAGDGGEHRLVGLHLGGQALGEVVRVDVECRGQPALELVQRDVAALEVDQRLAGFGLDRGRPVGPRARRGPRGR